MGVSSEILEHRNQSRLTSREGLRERDQLGKLRNVSHLSILLVQPEQEHYSFHQLSDLILYLSNQIPLEGDDVLLYISMKD